MNGGNIMNVKIKKMIQKHGGVITSLAIVAATMASGACRSVLYEPEVPEGIEKLMEIKMKNKRKY